MAGDGAADGAGAVAAAATVEVAVDVIVEAVAVNGAVEVDVAVEVAVAGYYLCCHHSYFVAWLASAAGDRGFGPGRGCGQVQLFLFFYL